MINLNQELEDFDAYFFKRHGELPLDPTSEEYANKSYLKHEMFKAWKARAKAQAVPTWIPTSTMLPDDGEEVLFLDSHNVIHEGSLNTDYVDGPYGENNEDHGDYQTLWTSNSNGEEFLLEEIKFWMARPSDPITCGLGAANE
ncbi:hypothetical protein OXA12_03485 [Acinetobacter baumannii]|uniref:hypothetical protein n=1 Tax=Acinetobacter baumannii TaxID=470 RepID=UPI001D0342AF|nr:hypothetical protein [Acinetobacter baumannii]MCY2773803.1 hypothetical protein [Acinetobacter baumannii]MCY2775232.1 hypothetical protein [Acinetobacter baumannii]MCY2798169.1 hypothetical protein [Acinetobacter baumannii]MCY2805626.1 hypothetical protein [Acinetobacter baumannii]MCY2885489.1 hypothetical protein [Acinetobacter baumannii]